MWALLCPSFKEKKLKFLSTAMKLLPFSNDMFWTKSDSVWMLAAYRPCAVLHATGLGMTQTCVPAVHYDVLHGTYNVPSSVPFID